APRLGRLEQERRGREARVVPTRRGRLRGGRAELGDDVEGVGAPALVPGTALRGGVVRRRRLVRRVAGHLVRRRGGRLVGRLAGCVAGHLVGRVAAGLRAGPGPAGRAAPTRRRGRRLL